jgi:RNA polymerase sigma-70 factor (family 1)
MVLSPEKDNIQDYVQAFQRGEEAGFTYFFNSLYEALTYYAFRIVDDRHTAEEIAGDAFIKLWKRHTLFDNSRAIKSWLYTTVRHDCLHYLKQEQKTLTQQEHLAKDQKNIHESFVLHEMIRAEVLREIYKNIESLPGACRNIFRMLYIQGKTVREIADELQLSISTIKNHKARGIALLRNRFPDFSILILLDLLNRH